MSLNCLIYTSVAKQSMTDDRLALLLHRSRLNNEALNITGMLLYLDPFFIQILEGEENVINAMFKKISADPLHHKISLVLQKTIVERSFSTWAMGFNQMSHAEMANIDTLVSLDHFYQSDAFKNSPKDIIELLEMFKNESLF